MKAKIHKQKRAIGKSVEATMRKVGKHNFYFLREHGISADQMNSIKKGDKAYTIDLLLKVCNELGIPFMNNGDVI